MDAEHCIELLSALLNIDYKEVEEIYAWLDEAVVDLSKFAEFVQEQVSLVDTHIWDLGLGSLALEYICQEAGIDELIPYLDGTKFGIKHSEANRLMEEVLEEDRTPAWYFLCDYLNIDFEVNE